jgi:hypothetical protein
MSPNGAQPTSAEKQTMVLAIFGQRVARHTSTRAEDHEAQAERQHTDHRHHRQCESPNASARRRQPVTTQTSQDAMALAVRWRIITNMPTVTAGWRGSGWLVHLHWGA